MADTVTNACDDRRLPYAASLGEGENACVIGPNEEILVEITHGDANYQWGLAGMIPLLESGLQQLRDHFEKRGGAEGAQQRQPEHA